MDVRTMFFALIVMLYPARFMKQTRDELLYPNKMENRILAYFGAIVCVIIIQGFMLMWHLELSKDFSRRGVVSTCYIYVMLNVAAQILIYRRENRETSHLRYDYFKWIWLVGVALYSGVFIMALWNQEKASLWLLGAGILHTLYNLAYFFFLYFTEKEIMQTRIRPEELKMDVMRRVKPDIVPNIKTSSTSNMGVDRKLDTVLNANPDRSQGMETNVEANRNFDEAIDAGAFNVPDIKLSSLQRVNGMPYKKEPTLEDAMRDAVKVIVVVVVMIGFAVGGLYLSGYPFGEGSSSENVAQEETGHEKPRIVTQDAILQQLNLEEEVLKRLEEDAEEFLHQDFPEMDDTVLESAKEVCAEKAKLVQNLANYGIVERETRDYKKYTVELEVIPANIFQTLQGNFEEVKREKVESEIYDDVPRMYMDIVEESIQRSIDGNTYGERRTIEVTVTVLDDECEIDETEREKIFDAIFPQ